MTGVCRTLAAAALALALLLASATPARAADDPPRRWYGWQILPSDGAATALIILGTQVKSGWPMGIGFASYLVGGPIVHWAHGHVGKGFGSLGMRLTAVGALVTLSIVAFDFGSSPIKGLWRVFTYGVVVFAVAAVAMAIDIALLAREDDPSAGGASTGLRSSGLSLAAPRPQLGWSFRF